MVWYFLLFSQVQERIIRVDLASSSHFIKLLFILLMHVLLEVETSIVLISKLFFDRCDSLFEVLQILQLTFLKICVSQLS